MTHRGWYAITQNSNLNGEEGGAPSIMNCKKWKQSFELYFYVEYHEGYSINKVNFT